MKIEHLIVSARLAAALAAPSGALACSSCGAGPIGRHQGDGNMENAWTEPALAAVEKTGRLEGMEIEYYVSGGLPPPHYRSDQFRALTREGRDLLEYARPSYTAKPAQGASYPLDIYTLPATPDEIRTLAKLTREAPPPQAPGPDQGAARADAVRTELLVMLGVQEAKRVYAGRQPPEVSRLREVVEAHVGRLVAQGEHRVKP